MKYIVPKEDLEKIIKTAFKDGENWGVCYSTWFDPTPERTEEELKTTKSKILRKLRKYQFKTTRSVKHEI